MRKYGYILLLLLALAACREQQLTFSEDAQLSFSTDSVCFDTVFTAAGSSTRQVMVYNHNANAVRISRVWWQKGKCFFANLDGESDLARLQDIDLNGGDSLFLFIRTEIDPLDETSNPLEVDTLFFAINGRQQGIAVQAYGLNVLRLPTDTVYEDLTLDARQPYLIFDTLCVVGQLTIQAGATLYMHPQAAIQALGRVKAEGTADAPIRIQGDRTDWLFEHVPYRVASGQWDGIYLLHYDSIDPTPSTYRLAHIEIQSGQVGLYCYSDQPDRATLHLTDAHIHNMSAYGVVAENTDALLSNVEISNCASYGLYLAGGQHTIEHTTVANYFGYPYTTLNIHSAKRQKVPAVYVLAHSYDMAESQSTFRNCLFTGAETPAFVVDSIPETGFDGTVEGCYLQCDTLPETFASANVYAQAKDSVFKNTHYKYGEYIYYDFHLVESTPARHIGLPLSDLFLSTGTDLDGLPRDTDHPDAGCYSFQ
ncbi:MAG: right-handed parallel beta-helix repeat-containing protein [Paludibacteraceae bacterium]|nr:right-handed parallel beta-helix repeat-containing protein [Paludibacteraceae bacterium]